MTSLLLTANQKVSTQSSQIGRVGQLQCLDSHATFEAEHVTESGVVFELTWRGTNTGPMQGPDGEIPATGKSMEMRSCYVIEMGGR